MEAEQAKIDAALSYLDKAQTEELLALMAVESDTPDIAAVHEEVVLAGNGVQPHPVMLTRSATKALMAEATRRLSAPLPSPRADWIAATHR